MADNCLTKVMFNEILNLPHNQIDVPFRYIDNMKCIFESRDMDHMFIIQIMLTDIKINVDSHILLFYTRHGPLHYVLSQGMMITVLMNIYSYLSTKHGLFIITYNIMF